MWIFLPAFYLAVAHIAGDNVALVPDLAAFLPREVFIATVVVYILLGTGMTGMAGWIGVQGRQELTVLAGSMSRSWGKKLLAVTVLSVCLPASALTGGYYTGYILERLFSIPHFWTAPFCLLLFSLLAAGRGRDIVKFSNYLALMLIPLVFYLLVSTKPEWSLSWPQWQDISWITLSILIGYNIGGMRSILTVEAAAHLAGKGYKTILLVILAKLLEGMFTLLVAELIVGTAATGPLALSGLAGRFFSEPLWWLFHLALFCTFLNTMAPAMLVNARQVSVLTGYSFWRSLTIAYGLVSLGSYLPFTVMLSIISIAGLSMVLFLLYSVYFLYRQ